MNEYKHYHPILKWKSAEKKALLALTAEVKKNITPLIQFVMPKLSLKEAKGKSDTEKYELTITKFQERLKEIPSEIKEYWGSNPISFDISLLYTTELKIEAIKYLLEKEAEVNLHVVPVIHLGEELNILEAVKNSKHGLSLRLVCSDLEDIENLNIKITKLLTFVELTEKDIDLLVDIKDLPESSDNFSKYINICRRLPNLLKWRTFTFASGAFHEDMSQCKLDEENLIPRKDWNSWAEVTKDESFPRKPCFADYTIQYPIYKESAQFFASTASVKYSLDNAWYVLKGKKQKFEDYLAHAKVLDGDPRFMGKDFSAGDKFIKEKADHFEKYMKNKELKGTGNTEAWLSVGINHHLTLVVHQLSKLP
jgi:hypothetical protein